MYRRPLRSILYVLDELVVARYGTFEELERKTPRELINILTVIESKKQEEEARKAAGG